MKAFACQAFCGSRPSLPRDQVVCYIFIACRIRIHRIATTDNICHLSNLSLKPQRPCGIERYFIDDHIFHIVVPKLSSGCLKGSISSHKGYQSHEEVEESNASVAKKILAYLQSCGRPQLEEPCFHVVDATLTACNLHISTLIAAAKNLKEIAWPQRRRKCARR